MTIDLPSGLIKTVPLEEFAEELGVERRNLDSIMGGLRENARRAEMGLPPLDYEVDEDDEEE